MARFALVLFLFLTSCATPRFIPYWSESADGKLATVVESLETLRAEAVVKKSDLPYSTEVEKSGEDLLVDLEIAREAVAYAPDAVKKKVDIEASVIECRDTVDDLYKKWKAETKLTVGYIKLDLPQKIRTCRNALDLNRDLK